MVIAGIIITIAAFILHLIGFATPYWYKDGIHQGLWLYCGANDCVTFPSQFLSDQFKAAQALECLAFIAFLATIVVIVLKLFVMKDQSILYIVMALGNFIAGGFSMLGVIVYGTLDGVDSSKFHFSFGFCIVAALAAVVAGALIIIGKRQ